MKRRIKQNVWGNWKGYLGTRQALDFGTDEVSAPLARDWHNGTPNPRAELGSVWGICQFSEPCGGWQMGLGE